MITMICNALGSLTLAVAEPAADYQSLTTGGWTIMILSVGFVAGLLGWCVWKVVSTPGETEHLHTQADIETPDRDV